jgi:hypothetical protein
MVRMEIPNKGDTMELEVKVGDLFQNNNGVGFEVVEVRDNGYIDLVKLGDTFRYTITADLMTRNLTKLT